MGRTPQAGERRARWHEGEGSAAERSWENHAGTCVPGARLCLLFGKQASQVAIHRLARHGDPWREKQGAPVVALPRVPSARVGAESYPRMGWARGPRRPGLRPPPLAPSGRFWGPHPQLQVPSTVHRQDRARPLWVVPTAKARGTRPPNLPASLGDQPPRNGNTQHSGPPSQWDLGDRVPVILLCPPHSLDTAQLSGGDPSCAHSSQHRWSSQTVASPACPPACCGHLGRCCCRGRVVAPRTEPTGDFREPGFPFSGVGLLGFLRIR